MPTISSHADRAALTRILAELARSLPSGEITVRFNQARVSDIITVAKGTHLATQADLAPTIETLFGSAKPLE